MLDELLGRAALKERIEELEDERDSLEARLEAESDRRADAVTARQEAEERVNRLEDRLEELEDRLDRAGEDAAAVDFRDAATLRGDDRDAVLDRLESYRAPPEGAVTAMVGEGDDVPDPVADLLGERAALVRRARPCLVCLDDRSLVAAALRPPLAPDPFCERGERFRVDRSWFRPQGRFAVALVRAGLFAYGAYDGQERVDYHGFRSDVKGEHDKGGFSQARFERRRDEQVAAHVDDCREALSDRDVDPLYVVGDERLIGEFEDVAARTAAVDASGDPADALGAAVTDFLATRLFLL